MSAKLAVLVAVAAVLTWRAGLPAAAAAHRVWCLVLLSPFALLAGSLTVSPSVLLLPDQRLLDIAARTGTDPGRSVVPMLAVYATVSTALVVRLIVGLRAVRRLVHESRPVTRDVAVAARAVLGEEVELRYSGLQVPVTAGFLQPVILLPADWESLPEVQRTAVLGHEHAHVRRGDYAWGVVASVLAALLWFHPAVWVAARRTRWFAELASDHAASSSMGASAYATALAGMAARWRQERPARFAVTVGVHSGVVRRLRLLIADRRASRRGTALAGLGLLVAAWLLAPAVGIRLGADDVGAADAGGGWHDAFHQSLHGGHAGRP
jgi:beta-lactamase regulating signal transducer with metallopeptidase domain